MKVKVYTQDGNDSGREIELNDDIFGIEPNQLLIYEDVRRVLAAQRQGTAKTKQRGEVRGGGKKAYRQKGTGNARRGSMRSPLLKGGGTVFGPQPRKYTIQMSKKQKRLARRSALSLKAAENAILVVEDFTMEKPRTKSLIGLLNALNLQQQKVLFLFGETNEVVAKSLNNIPKVKPAAAYQATTYDMIHSDVIVLKESAVQALSHSIVPQTEEAA